MQRLPSLQGVDQDELFFEAKNTFISMAERFDASKKARLTTYAWAQIMSNLQHLCENEGALLPMSVSANRDTVKLGRAENELSQQTGDSPSLAAVAAKVIGPCFVTYYCSWCRQSTTVLQWASWGIT